jgi:Fe-S-cluster containining protein
MSANKRVARTLRRPTDERAERARMLRRSPQLSTATIDQISEPLRCDGCRACCRGDHQVQLVPGEDPKQYETQVEPVRLEDHGAPWAVRVSFEKLSPDMAAQYRDAGVTHVNFNLRRKENGDCWYLGERGCTIYHRRPQICRRFDCRELFISMSRAERRDYIKDIGGFAREVLEAGRQRLVRGNPQEGQATAPAGSQAIEKGSDREKMIAEVVFESGRDGRRHRRAP